MMDNKRSTSTQKQISPSPAELRKLPPQERDAIIEAQAAEAEHEYRTNPDLTDFEAFEEEDGPYDDEPPTESR